MPDEIHEMVEVTSFGERRRFMAGRQIAKPTEIDRLVVELRDLANFFDDEESQWQNDLVHQAADSLALLQRALNAALGRITEADRG